MTQDAFQSLFDSYYRSVPRAVRRKDGWYSKNIIGAAGPVPDFSFGIHAMLPGLDNRYRCCGSLAGVGFGIPVSEIGTRHPRAFQDETVIVTAVRLERRLTGECRVCVSYKTVGPDKKKIFSGDITVNPSIFTDEDIHSVFSIVSGAMASPRRKRPITIKY